MTIPTYRDLQDRIAVLEGKLDYWSNLNVLGLDEITSKYEPEFGPLHDHRDDEDSHPWHKLNSNKEDNSAL